MEYHSVSGKVDCGQHLFGESAQNGKVSEKRSLSLSRNYWDAGLVESSKEELRNNEITISMSIYKNFIKLNSNNSKNLYPI